MKAAFSVLIAGALLALPAAHSATTATWEMSNYRDFLAGQFNGVSLHRDGRLQLAPRIETFFASDQPIIWSVVQAPDGSLYAGTGHRGRLFRIDKSGKSSLIWTADQPEIFALAIDRQGVLYAATSPDGKIYRIEQGKAVEYFAPGTRYIWSLAFGADGKLYAGTGDEGKIFRIDGPGKGEVFYATGQTHVTSLAFDREQRLLAGSEPNGIIYRIYAKDKAFVLYDAALPEIRSLVPTSDGSVYAVAMGGSLIKQSLGAGTLGTQSLITSVPSTTTSITVTEEAQAGVEIKPQSEAAKTAVGTAGITGSPILDVAGVEKSAVYKIASDNTVETLWSSKEENAYDLLLSGGDIVFGTDGNGRIYRLTPDRKLTLLAQTNEGETTRLFASGNGLLAATGNMGKVFRLGDTPVQTGIYESPVHDAGTVARWGRVSWRGESLDSNNVRLMVRTGNSARPDRTWSDWSAPLSAGAAVPNPNARYIQWKAELRNSGGRSPVIDNVTIAYLPQNTAPALKGITVINQPAAGAARQSTQSQSTASASYSITVTDSGDAGTHMSTGTQAQVLGRSASEQLQITWQAEDPEGDRMLYTLFFRGEDEREWKVLKRDLTENSYSIDSDVLADGRYYFRVIASDLPSNAASAAREAEIESSPVLVDRTPPLVRAGNPRRSGSRIEIDFEAADAASELRRSEYSLNAGPWIPIEATDGVLDSFQEEFRLTLNELGPGEQHIVVRVFDAAGNAGLTKVIIR